MRKYVLYLALLGLTACNSYHILKEFKIPLREHTRLESLVKKAELTEINPEKTVPQDCNLSSYSAPFFVFLYHLESSRSQYVVNKESLISFFEKKELDTLVPLEAIEKIVKEGNVLRFYNSAFSRTIPETYSQISLDASENIQFRVEEGKDGIELHLIKGSLHVTGTDLAAAAGFNDFECNYVCLQQIENEFSVIFAYKKGKKKKGFRMYLGCKLLDKVYS